MDAAPVTRKAHWLLTPHPARSCWRKKHKGQQYYVGKGTSRYSEADYKRALAEWQQIEERLEKEALEARRAFHRRLDDDIDDQAQALWGYRPAADSRAISEAEARRETAEEATVDSSRSLGACIDRFVGHKTTHARTGRLKGGGRVANIRSYLKAFRLCVGEKTPVEKIGEAVTLADFYDHLMEAVEADRIEDNTAADKMQAAKQFIRWAWSLDLCQLPRNIDSKEMVIYRTPGQINPMPLPVLREVVRAATGRLRLLLLLMANCGFVQIDCAELLHKEVNWRAGTITRKRSKRAVGRDKEVPVVTYYLWPSTLELLREQASQDNELVLPNDNGIAAVRSEIGKDGKVSRTDNFRTAYDRLWDRMRKAQEQKIADLTAQQVEDQVLAGVLEIVEGKPQLRKWAAKTIRKASSTAIGNHREFGRFAQYFLGQSPKTVADTHYIRPSEGEFRATLQWLGEHLELDAMAKIGSGDEAPS